MCGISGFLALKGKYNGPAMLNSLHHRGPDSEGTKRIEIGEHELFLAHNRLKIIDLSPAGSQPMILGDDEFIIVFNGEIYNFLELKAEFFSGESFVSTSDTEVLLRLYKKLGIQFLKHLNGDFAFSIYDKQQQKLFLVRDRSGVKPLYYYAQNNELVFGSELKALFKAGIKPILNNELIHSYFVFKYIPGEYTFLKNIHRLKPGSYLEVDLNSGKKKNSIYWELSENQPAIQKISYQDAQSEVRRLMDDSIRLRLIADVPIGTFLSGGLDSSIIASYLQGRNDILHYCAGKSREDLAKEGSTSDFDYAQRLAKDWKLNLTEIPIGVEELNVELLDLILGYSDDLIADGSQIPSYLISKEASVKTRVLLSGMGADELFLGYVSHMLSVMAIYSDTLPNFVMNPLSNFLSNLNQGKGALKVYKRYLHKIGKYHALPYRNALFSVVGDYEMANAVYTKDHEFTQNYLTSYFPKERDSFYSLLKFEAENFLVKNLHYVDRTAMANAIETRVPFLDHRLIEFAATLPREYKISPLLKTKRILKDAYKEVLPFYILDRRKAGFGMPLRSLLAQQKVLDKLLSLEFFASIPGFDIDNIKQVIANQINGKEEGSALLFALISFQHWHKKTFE